MSRGAHHPPQRGHDSMLPLEKETTRMMDYRPSEDEPFMNEREREYFRKKLLEWKGNVLKEAKDGLAHLQEEDRNHPDPTDRASSEAGWAMELRARDRQRKLIAKIDAALKRLDEGTYGYCLETVSRSHFGGWRPFLFPHSQFSPRIYTN
jgi:DnaK suppressor protein